MTRWLPMHTHWIAGLLVVLLPIEADAAVTVLATSPNVFLANPAAVPARTVAEFVAFSRSRPGKLNYGSSGNGGGHLAMEMLKSMTGIKVVLRLCSRAGLLSAEGFCHTANSPDELRRHIDVELKRWKDVMVQTNAKLQ